MLCGHTPSRRRDNLFLICQVISYDHNIRGSCDIMGGLPSLCVTILPSCHWWSQILWKRSYFVLSLSGDLTWLRGQRVMWHYGWVFLIIRVYPAKFGNHSRAYCSCFMHAIVAHMRLPFFKIIQILYIFAQIFKYFRPFLPFFCKITCMSLLSRIDAA